LLARGFAGVAHVRDKRAFIVSPTAVNSAETRLRHSDYIAALRPLLPAEAFRPHPRAFLPIAINVAIIVCGWVACRYLGRAWWPLIAIVIGSSSASMAFLAHDFAHRSVTRNRALLYPMEVVLWAFNMFPATLWRRVHAAHHAHTNGTGDPDRRFLPSELSLTGVIAAATLFPNRLKFNVSFWLQWFVYPMRHAIAALLYPGTSKPDFVTAKPNYFMHDKVWIALEIAFLAAWQIGLWLFLGAAVKLIFVTVIPIAITSAVVSWYFYTNHSLNPVDDGSDIVAATTSVIVPGFFNKLHSNFAYHTEHHLFPSMNPAFYPLVSKLLREHFPERYQRIPIWRAWRVLLRNPIATSRRGAPPAGAARAAAPTITVTPSTEIVGASS
jgi:fatty acid desaturase